MVRPGYDARVHGMACSRERETDNSSAGWGVANGAGMRAMLLEPARSSIARAGEAADVMSPQASPASGWCDVESGHISTAGSRAEGTEAEASLVVVERLLHSWMDRYRSVDTTTTRPFPLAHRACVPERRWGPLLSRGSLGRGQPTNQASSAQR